MGVVMSSRVGRGLQLLFVCVFLSTAGCGGAKAPCTLDREAGSLAISADSRLNPDDAGDSLPTRVRVLQLTNARVLDEIDFEDFWGDPKSALGPALIADSEITIFPGGREIRDFSLDPQAHYLAVIALVRRPIGKDWISVIDLRGLPYECPVKKRRVRKPIPLRANVNILLREYKVEAHIKEERISSACADSQCRKQENE